LNWGIRKQDFNYFLEHIKRKKWSFVEVEWSFQVEGLIYTAEKLWNCILCKSKSHIGSKWES